MHWLDPVILTLGLGGGLLFAGYWLAAGLPAATTTPAERIALAPLAGLASLLGMVAAVNLFAPLRGWAAWLCVLLPVAFTLRKAARRRLWQDSRVLLSGAATWWVLAGAGALWTALLWPLLSDGSLVFYDGAGNHDSFFWVAGAEHLLRHPYLEGPPAGSAPWLDATDAILGWRPIWGRMGAEGLLALVSAVTGRTTLEIYLVATAALLLPWLSGVFLVSRTFVLRGPARPVVWGVVAGLQPLFVFYHRNQNLPNLLGILMATAVLLGLGRALPRRREAVPWATVTLLGPSGGLTVLGAHGLLCAYPEMLAFVLLSAALLGARAGWAAGWRAVAGAGVVLAVGLLINPATTVRAVHGLVSSSAQVRADEHWFNMFQKVPFAGYLPTLTTLSAVTFERWGGPVDAVLSAALLLGLGWTVRRARDPLGSLALLAGAVVLLLYTVLTSFSYGWQKSAQFAGIFIAALIPAGVLANLDGRLTPPGRSGWRFRLPVGALAVFLLGSLLQATADACRSVRFWAEQKHITRDWLALTALSKTSLRGAPVLVVGESFSQPFFYGMWASYLLPDSALVFSARDDHPGGYLELAVKREPSPVTTPPPVTAVLVSRAWADSVDASSQRLVTGADFALLRESNRVLAATGVEPVNGVPQSMTTGATLSLQPTRDGWLHLTLWPAGSAEWAEGCHLQVENVMGGQEGAAAASPGGSPPWTVLLPLRGGRVNRVNVGLAGEEVANGHWPGTLQVETLRVTDAP